MAVNDALGLLSLFTGKKTTTSRTTGTKTSKAGVKAATDEILRSLIPGAIANQQAVGGFNSSAYSLAAADAAAKAGAYAEELNKQTTVTETSSTPAAIDPKLGLALFAGNALWNSDFGKGKRREITDWLFGSQEPELQPLQNLFQGITFGNDSNNGGGGGGLNLFSLLPTFANGGDAQQAFQEMQKLLKNGKQALPQLGMEFSAGPKTGSSVPLEPNNFAGYGDKVIRDTPKELGMFANLATGMYGANPLKVAGAVSEFAKYDAQMRLLQGIGEDAPSKINQATADLESIGAFADTVGVVGKVKGIKDSIDQIQQLTNIMSAVETGNEKALVGVAGANAVASSIKNIQSLSNMRSGASDLPTGSSGGGDGGNGFGGFYNGNPTNPNWSMGNLYSNPMTSSGFASGGLVPGQKDTVGADRVLARLSGGEFLIPADVVDAIGSDTLQRLINALHKKV